MTPDEKLQELLTYFETATYPEVPFKINRYMTIVADPNEFVKKIAKDIADPRASQLVKDSILQPLYDLKKCCDEGQGWQMPY